MKKNLLNKFWLRVGMIVAVMTTALSSTAWGQTTYKLEQVTSVEAGGLYVFEQGGYVMINTISSSALQTTNTYKTTGLTGTETYVWTLETGTNGFYLKNKYLESTVTNGLWYLKNGSSTGVSFDIKTSLSLWNISFTEGIALIQNTNNRFLGWTTTSSHLYKAYAASNLNSGSYPHAIKVYQLVEEGGGTPLTDSDLALTGAPVALNFDLYNNTDPQTISYTTSSTGEVTVSPSDYVTCEVNETAKTITVTPIAVTFGAQTITVNQAADDNYKAGTATFTITVDDSTPFTGATFDATIDKGTSPILKDNVSFACDNGVLNNGSEYRLYKNSTTTFSTTDGSLITKIEFTGVSGYSATGFSSQTGWTTSGNNGVWTGEAESVSFVASGAQVRATLIKVWLKPNTNPFIAAENVDIACNAVEGAITYTLTNPATNGVLTASTTSDWLTIGTVGETVPFTCTANETTNARTATVTLTYTYGNNQTVTKDVSVTQAGRKNAGLAYATANVTKFEGDVNFTNELTNPYSLVVTYASSEETVATVDNNGEVTILAAGTTTITASYSGDETYLPGSASYTLVVNEPFVAEDGVFDFVEAGKQGYDYGSGVPIAHSSNGTYIYEDRTWIAGNVTLVSSGKYRWWYNGHELRFYNTAGDNDATKESAMTISVPEGKVITGIEVSGGKNWTTDCGTYENGTWTGYSQTVVFTFTETSSNNVTKVVVTYGDPISVTFNSSGYATFASSSPIDFSGAEADGYTAWAITSANKTTSVINFSRITGAVTAGTGVLLMGEPGETVYPVVASSGETPANNLLVGFTEATYVESNLYYGLKGDTFKRVNAGTVPAGKALLPASQVGTEVKTFTFNFEDDATGISNIDVNLNEGAIYNLAGQRLQKMQKGINIVNGKKVLK